MKPDSRNPCVIGIDALVASLRSPTAPAEAPAWTAEEARGPVEVLPRMPAPASRRRERWIWALGSTCAAAAGLVLVFAVTRPRVQDTWQFRGAGGGPPVEVGLRLTSLHDGVVRRAPRDEPLQVGEEIYFRAEATREAPVSLWVELGREREEIAHFFATPSPSDVKIEGNWVVYVPEKAGRYTFFLSAGEGAGCAAPSCTSVSVEVE
jgi:hypothetical protein